jgi:hypothetical protein
MARLRLHACLQYSVQVLEVTTRVRTQAQAQKSRENRQNDSLSAHGQLAACVARFAVCSRVTPPHLRGATDWVSNEVVDACRRRPSGSRLPLCVPLHPMARPRRPILLDCAFQGSPRLAGTCRGKVSSRYLSTLSMR